MYNAPASGNFVDAAVKFMGILRLRPVPAWGFAYLPGMRCQGRGGEVPKCGDAQFVERLEWYSVIVVRVDEPFNCPVGGVSQ